MNSLSEKILQKIKDENIRPIPRWIFVFRKIAMYVLLVFAILLGSVSFSMILTNLDFSEFSHGLSHGFRRGIFVLPFLWLIVTSVLLVLSYFNYRKTSKGYRVSTGILILVLLMSSLLLGGVLHLNGASYRIHRMIRHSMPFYNQMHSKMMDQSCDISQGMLCGEIIGNRQDQISLRSFKIQTTNGEIWDIQAQEADIRGWPRLLEEGKIRVWGNVKGDKAFNATEIRPMPPKD